MVSFGNASVGAPVTIVIAHTLCVVDFIVCHVSSGSPDASNFSLGSSEEIGWAFTEFLASINVLFVLAGAPVERRFALACKPLHLFIVERVPVVSASNTGVVTPILIAIVYALSEEDVAVSHVTSVGPIAGNFNLTFREETVIRRPVTEDLASICVLVFFAGAPIEFLVVTLV